MPIKGVDDDTAPNVAALLEQDYLDYRVIFTVESNDDPVVTLLERIAVEDSRVEIVIAGLAQERGQKVHNQLAAVGRTNEDDEILTFMDVDAKPGPEWLRALITPLTYGPHIGAATGYRYYIPVTDHTANKIVSVLNAQVAALLGPYRRNFAWGGSMAIRRADFFTYGLNDMWQHALSDDYCLSYCVKNVAKKKLQFVPRCLVASDANFNWASLFEFAVRQYRITKVCAPGIWVLAVLGAMVYLAAFSFTLGNTIRGFTNPEAYTGHEHLIQMLMFTSLYCFSLTRGFLLIRRRRAAASGKCPRNPLLPLLGHHRPPLVLRHQPGRPSRLRRRQNHRLARRHLHDALPHPHPRPTPARKHRRAPRTLKTRTLKVGVPPGSEFRLQAASIADAERENRAIRSRNVSLRKSFVRICVHLWAIPNPRSSYACKSTNPPNPVAFATSESPG